MKMAIAGLAFLLSTVAASAQCRAQRMTVSEELHTPGEAVVGTVVGAQAVPDSSFHLDGVNYVVRVDHVLCGKMIESSIVKVFSENSPERFPMQIGQQYLLFVHLDYDRYEVDNCGNSGLLSATNVENMRDLKLYAKK
jgi:hypothetical protein